MASNTLLHYFLLLIAHVDANSLINKVNYLFAFLVDYNLSIVSIIKTWLLLNVPDSLTHIFFLLRKMLRIHFTGRVLVYMFLLSCFSEVNTHAPNTLADFLSALKLYVLVASRPPSHTTNDSDRALLIFSSAFLFRKGNCSNG